jgi:transposase InsO family protein
MAKSTSIPSGHKIYNGIVFSPGDANYSDWKNSTYNAIKWSGLARYSIPTEQGGSKVQKEKPVGDEEKIEAWEDHAEKALVLINESLGEHNWVIKDCKTPVEAFKVMHSLYSGATNNDAMRLETKWVNETPKGDAFMEYIATMTLLKDKLKTISIDKTEKELCLRMMGPLSAYPEEHPFREAWKWLDNQFTDNPEKVNLAYFKRYVLSATDKINAANTERTKKKSEREDDSYALSTIARLTERLEKALAMTTGGGNRSGGGTNASTYTGCRFCKSLNHEIRNCDHPHFDLEKWKRSRNGGKPQADRSNYSNKGRSDNKNGRGKSEKANWAEDDSDGEKDRDSNVSTGTNAMKMKNSVDCYVKIGKHPSPEIDSGAVSKRGATSLAPPVRPPREPLESKNSIIADMIGGTASFISESISEQLFNATISDIPSNGSDTILDSGCTRTMWRDKRMFASSTNYKECDISVKVGDGHIIKAKGIGNVTIRTGGNTAVTIPSCLWVPDLKLNLISVSHLDTEGFSTKFENGMSRIYLDGKIILKAKKKDNLYHLDIPSVSHERANSALTADIIHRRMGHFAIRRIRRMAPIVNGLEENDLQRLPTKVNCDSCVRAKSKRTSFPPSISKTEAILDLLHMDLAGPAEVESVGGKRYLLVIVDDYSRLYHGILLRNKSDAFEEARNWIRLQERRTGLKVKCIRSDNGGEFVSDLWSEYYTANGIRHERTVPYTPEQNGKAERAVGILKDGIRAYLLESGLGKSYWGAAAINFTYTRNMIPTTHAPGTTPYETFYGTKPDVSRLRAFGCVAYVHIPKQRRKGAWSPRARKVVFIGYAEQDGTKAWVFYDPVMKERIVSIHAEFWEGALWDDDRSSNVDKIVFSTPVTSTSVSKVANIRDHGPQDDDIIEIVRDQPAIPLRRSARLQTQYNQNAAHLSLSLPFQELVNLLELDEHQPNLDEVLYRAFLASGEQDHTHSRFLEAKQKELASMYENKVWELVPLPPGERAIACRWLCTDKLLADLTTTEKARLIVLGHLQRAGLDYQEIFAPVLKMESVRILLALIAMYDMEFIQGDVKTAFLYGPLEETVYMRQPPGFAEKGKESWVCRLQKAVYGLHQAPRAFYLHISKVLGKAGFKSIHGDPSIFVRVMEGHTSFIGLYVDDAIIASSSSEHLAETKRFLNQHFKMTWTDNPKMLLGIEINRDREAGTLQISQKHYAEDILRVFDMSNCNPKKFPMLKPFTANTSEEKQKPDLRFPYLEFIGKLNYLARGTRPDLAFVASHLATFCSCYQKEHWEACLDVMRYIKGTTGAGIVYSTTGNPRPIGYSDANYATDPGDRKSISGYAFTYAGGMISWKSKKQPVVALSSCESELVALDMAAREAIWITSLFEQLRKPVQLPLQIWEDNQGTINITKNPVNHPGTKHIAVRYFAVRDWIQAGKVKIDYLNTASMLADALTKPLNGTKLRTLCEGMGMKFSKPLVVK